MPESRTSSPSDASRVLLTLAFAAMAIELLVTYVWAVPHKVACQATSVFLLILAAVMPRKVRLGVASFGIAVWVLGLMSIWPGGDLVSAAFFVVAAAFAIALGIVYWKTY